MNRLLLTRIIEVVMQSQKALVDVVGKFTPKIVKMDGAKHKSWKKGNRDEVMGE
jgi:tRNA-splicing ligase RtcB (3'-phosphate/5'-hydroxy nucleic acid ligase)